MTEAFVVRTWDLAGYDGDQAPPHVHFGGEEAFICINGDFEVVVEGERRRVAPGDHAVVPRGAAHTFASHQGARIVAVMTPEIAALIEALHDVKPEERGEVWQRYNSAPA